MQNPPREVIVAFFASLIFWVLVVVGIWALSRRWERARAFWERMLGQWRPALGITLVYFFSVLLSGRGLNPYAAAVFCQALIGLAIARGIPNFEPLPVSRSALRRERVVKTVVLFILFALLVGVVGMLAGTIGIDIGRSIFHEEDRTSEAMGSFSLSKFQAFFLFISGAGIAEETTYRLVILSWLWSLTKRRGLAVVASALLFGAYHLTPLSGMYLTFLQYPISQFLGSTFIGLVWGYTFVKRGYETSVLAHTLSNWLPVLIFM